MDNLQVYYLSLIEAAQEHALHGNVDLCLNICFDLRLKPDLALWLRAMINLMLSNLTLIHEHPDKIKFAEEALRLAIELKSEEHPDKGAFWNAEYARLEQAARKQVALVQEEARSHQQAILSIPSSPDIEDKLAGLALGSQETQTRGRVKRIVIDSDDDDETVTPWELEGAFTLKLSHPAEEDVKHSGKGKGKEQRDAEDVMESTETGDKLTALPQDKGRQRTKTMRRERTHLPTPGYSSDVEGGY